MKKLIILSLLLISTLVYASITTKNPDGTSIILLTPQETQEKVNELEKENAKLKSLNDGALGRIDELNNEIAQEQQGIVFRDALMNQNTAIITELKTIK